jgi:hypothetical protein
MDEIQETPSGDLWPGRGILEFQLDAVRKIALDVVDYLGIAHWIRNIFTEETDSPWNEKGQIKRRKGNIDVKIAVWPDDTLLYGRVFRLFIYILDVLNPDFGYDPAIAPSEDKEPLARTRYNQIWSLYVDSRVERKGFANFFDRQLRKSLFIEMERTMPWKEAAAIFQSYWNKPVFTYPEIIECSRDIRRLTGKEGVSSSACLETDILGRIDSPRIERHLEKISSPLLKDMANDLLNFIAYNCKDANLEASYYGISFLYQRKTFIEFIPTSEGPLYLTYMDRFSDKYKTETIQEGSDIEAVKEIIRDVCSNKVVLQHLRLEKP